jgi:hypothetical protein
VAGAVSTALALAGAFATSSIGSDHPSGDQKNHADGHVCFHHESSSFGKLVNSLNSVSVASTLLRESVSTGSPYSHPLS